MDNGQYPDLPQDTRGPLSQIIGSPKNVEQVQEIEEDDEEEVVTNMVEKKKSKKKKEEMMKRRRKKKKKKEEEEKKKEEEEDEDEEEEVRTDLVEKKQRRWNIKEMRKPKKEVEEETKKKHFLQYNQLCKDIINGDWENTKRAFEIDPSAITAHITSLNGSALELAVLTGAPKQFINNLVSLMSKSDVEILGVHQQTALHFAGIVGNTEAARILVHKNPSLTNFRDDRNLTALHEAAQHAHKKTVSFLLPVTRLEAPSAFEGESGALLLMNLIVAEFYDIAIYLLGCYPDLAIQKDENGDTALKQLAQQPNSFFSGNQLNFLQRLLYKWIYVEKVNVHRTEDVENPAAEPKYPPSEPKQWKFKFLQHVHDAKLMHAQALQLTNILIAEAVKAKNVAEDFLLMDPILAAARLGIYELVWGIVKAFPDAIWYCDKDEHRPFHLAVLNRKEKVYNLVYQMSLQKHFMMAYTDNKKNNILHLAGKLGPSDRVSGAALQMQRELQWFKEVATVVQPSYSEEKNDDEKTPRELFTEKHKDLVKSGEEWMKTTATSCTVVAALIITVAFAAVFTLPGGSNNEGFPNFLNDLSFMIFAVSNALALFASSTSVLMFLGILTSRYSEGDFLRALPMRLCIGLVTLFLSIAFMLAAFSAALHIVLVHRLSWLAAPIIGLACVPLTFFAFLQFPLLIEMITSTFGRSIFHRQGKEKMC